MRNWITILEDFDENLHRFWYKVSDGEIYDCDDHHGQEIYLHPEYFGLTDQQPELAKYRAKAAAEGVEYDSWEIMEEVSEDTGIWAMMLDRGWSRCTYDIRRKSITMDAKSVSQARQMLGKMSSQMVLKRAYMQVGEQPVNLASANQIEHYVRFGRLPGRMVQEAYGDDVVKFWIDAEGKTHMLEPGMHHMDAIDDLGSNWVSAFRTGWVRGFFESRSETMNYCFLEKKVTTAAIKEMLRMAREWKATAFYIEEADDRNPASTELSSREFTQYIRSKSVAPAPLMEHTKHDGYQTWSTITDSYQGEAFGYCQAERFLDNGEKSPIGYVNFSIYQGRAHIKMIEVHDDWKRKGIATALMDELALLVDGEENIDWGEHTEDGMAFHKAYDSRKGHQPAS